VSWDRHASGKGGQGLMMTWRESGGPPVVAPGHSGYGTSLIRDLIPHELGGTVDLVFAAEGACCKIEVPLQGGGSDHNSAF